MAVLRDTIFPLANYPSGTHETGSLNVPDTARELYIEIARSTSADPTIWPNSATQLQIEIEGTTDGVTWIPAGGGGSSGGIARNIRGDELPFTTIVTPLPMVQNRQIRARAVITNGPLRTQGAVELRD